MWSNWEMKYASFIHNDDVKCFHVDVQGSHKLIVMGNINFKDHVLIKRQQVGKKMNVTGGMFKDEKKGNHRSQFAFVARSCARFGSFGVHSSMNIKSVIEKLQRILREKEVQKNVHRHK
jgi:hypothetical protein